MGYIDTYVTVLVDVPQLQLCQIILVHDIMNAYYLLLDRINLKILDSFKMDNQITNAKPGDTRFIQDG